MEASIKKLFETLSYQHRKILTIKEMVDNKEYSISMLERIDTKYGSRIRCVLDNEFYFYFPPKYTRLTKEQLDYLNLNQHKLVKRRGIGADEIGTLAIVKKRNPLSFYNLHGPDSDED